MSTYELSSMCSRKPTFFGRAVVEVDEDTGYEYLYSDDYLAASIQGGDPYLDESWDDAPARIEHVIDFFYQHDIDVESERDLRELIDEGRVFEL